MNDFLDFFFNVLMKICPWGSFSMEVFLLFAFLEILIVKFF